MKSNGLELEAYEERRRKWRRSGFWRGVLFTIVLLVVLAVGLGYALRPDVPRGPHIARYEILGMIRDDALRDDDLAAIAENPDARALILKIDSGGGASAGAEALYESIRRVAERKPVIALMGEAAASGGYLAAIAADHVIARGNTLTASIGVILEYPDLSGLIERVGVDMVSVRSSDIKGDPSPFRELTPEARAMTEEIVEDSHRWFLGLVAERRGLGPAELERVADGRVMTGRMALDLGLVDALGGESEALSHLEGLDPELAGLPVETWSPTETQSTIPGLDVLMRAFSGADRAGWRPGFRLLSVAP